MGLALKVLQYEREDTPSKLKQDTTVEIMMRYVLLANGQEEIRKFKYVIFCNHINLNIRDNRIKITWRCFVFYCLVM